MQHTATEIQTWAAAYIKARGLECVKPGHPLWWAIERSQLPSTDSEAEAVWSFVLEVLSRSPTEKVVGLLAAGPMEDLLDDWGSRFIERIEVEATRSAMFAEMLAYVWESGPPDVWCRIRRLLPNPGKND